MKSKSVIPIILISAITFLIWHQVLGQSFLGEAYMYFPKSQNFFTNISQHSNFLNNYNNFAVIMFDILSPIFKDNLQLYLLLQLIITTVLGSSLYWVIYKITKQRILGFLAAVFFLTNYTGSFEMMATGNYQRFAERVTSLIPAILSIYFLNQFYKNKIKYRPLIISLLLFSLGVFMAHFTTFLLPFFILYPVAQFIYNKKTKKSLSTNILIILSFTTINYLITQGSPQSPNKGIFQFLTQEKNLLERVLLQIPVITFPPNLIKLISKLYPHPLQFPYVPILKILFLPAIGLYLSGFHMIKNSKKNIKILYFTSFFGMLLEMVIYMFVDNRLNVLQNAGESRFFYITSMFASICWAIIVMLISTNKTKRYKIAPFLILTIYLIYNYFTINKNIDDIQYKSEMMKRYLSYVKQISPQFNEDTIVVVPVRIMWPSPMIQLYYGNPQMTITREFEGWEEELRDRDKNVFVLDYDYEKTEKGEFDPEKGHVVDLTAKYRMGKKIQFSE